MKGSLKLGNIAGIGIFIHGTFTLLIAYPADNILNGGKFRGLKRAI